MGSLGWELAALGISCNTRHWDSGKDCGDLQDANARQDRNRGGGARPAPPGECRCGLPPCSGPCSRARRPTDVASPYFSVMLKSLLGIPEPLQIYHLLLIGFAKRSPTIHHPRRALEEIVHHERYDRSKFRGEAELQDFMMKMSIRGTEYSF